MYARVIFTLKWTVEMEIILPVVKRSNLTNIKLLLMQFLPHYMEKWTDNPFVLPYLIIQYEWGRGQ